jgi:hypothetical protein
MTAISEFSQSHLYVRFITIADFVGIRPKWKRICSLQVDPSRKQKSPNFQNYIPPDKNIMHKVGTRFEIP